MAKWIYNTQWQYKTAEIFRTSESNQWIVYEEGRQVSDKPFQYANSLGHQGWELVSAGYSTWPGGQRQILWFKRPYDPNQIAAEKEEALARFEKLQKEIEMGTALG